jgi:hypothetical protein
LHHFILHGLDKPGSSATVSKLSALFDPSLSLVENGVPVVLEQKTTILWKWLYLLVSLKDSSGLGGTYETKRRSEEENPVHRQNTTVNVGKIRGFRPLYVWMKPFVFLHSLTMHQRCVVFCTLTTGTPMRS